MHEHRELSRFWANVYKTDKCWIWLGARAKDGYGKYTIVDPRSTNQFGTFSYTPHQFVWELMRGPVPVGLELDHKCRVTLCCNPDHLEPVTHAVNRARAIKPLCCRGHEQNEKNRYTAYVNGKPRGRCRLCVTAVANEQKAMRHARGLKKRGRKSKVS